MGRDTSRRAANPREVGLETFELARTTLGFNFEQALHTAIDAAVESAYRGFIVGVREDLLEKAEDIDADEDNDLNEDGPASLIWYAKLLDEVLPPEQRKGWN